MDLFGRQPVAQPLAARLRATSLDEYVGQEHVLGQHRGSAARDEFKFFGLAQGSGFTVGAQHEIAAEPSLVPLGDIML